MKPLAKSVLDAGIHNKILRSGDNTKLIISNAKMEDIIKVAKSLEDSGLLLKGVSEKVEIEAKEQKGGFHSMLLDTLGGSLLRNILAGKGASQGTSQGLGVNRAGNGRGINRAGEGIARAGYGNKKT